MNPNRGEASQASFETQPQPQSPETVDNSLEQGLESLPAAPEKSGNQSQAPALPLIPDDIPFADQPALLTGATDDQAIQASAPAALPDGDHIQEIWIDKIKSVIAQTRQDPYIQKNEISRIKAEYNQKRFNKTMKVDSGSE